MKIGILTLPLHTNYGGIIQVYALQEFLRRRGHDVWIINRDHWIREQNLPSTDSEESSNGRRYASVIESSASAEDKWINTKLFIDQHIGQHISSSNMAELHQNDLEAIVVGSDQIWRPEYVRHALRTSMANVFLHFAEDWTVRRLAYAASFGTDRWELCREETEVCSRLAKRFDAVSVREASAVFFCREYLGVNAEQVLDPTMLLDCSDYEELLDDFGKEEANSSVFSYMLDVTDDKMDAVGRISNFIDFGVVDTGRAGDEGGSYSEVEISSVESWLRSFRDARYVVTDSFHGCVFSILFGKEFFIYGNSERGIERFRSLLEILGLRSRMILSADEITEERLEEKIDWSHVSRRLEKEKFRSINFLETSLSE
ncbi:polysaccharide pyruvyl transferase family protein [Phytoactinopolyspora halophila]|nr:polysaccharide pyruvyl transferase family protein [Phytoactinopolyspora halophila]